MSDDDLNRREFLKGGISESDNKKGSKKSKDWGWKPGWEATTEGEKRRARKEVREQVGDIKEPQEKAFNALEFLSNLDDKNEQEPEIEQQVHRRRETIPVHRPPRAIPEPEFLEACTRCNACIEACPHDAIKLAGPRFREAEGTPVIDASTAPCLMCEDTPCVVVCEPDALAYAVGLSMGDAQIMNHDCIAHQGGFCSTCVEQCPVPGAIRVRDGKPTIRAGACTGCGVCHFVCPAPENAVRIFPRGTPEGAVSG